MNIEQSSNLSIYLNLTQSGLKKRMASVRGSAIPLKPGLSFLPAWMQSPPGVVTKPFLGLHPISQEGPDMGSPSYGRGLTRQAPFYGSPCDWGKWAKKRIGQQNKEPIIPSCETYHQLIHHWKDSKRDELSTNKQRPPLLKITNMLNNCLWFPFQQIICKMWK